MQSLHWAIQDAAERGETPFCCCLDFADAFNSTDHAALWLWLQELKVPDIDLLQSLYSGQERLGSNTARLLLLLPALPRVVLESS